jgi:hypothetical protein
MQATLRAIHDHGDSSSVAGILASFDERERIIRTEAFLDIDRKHAESS